MICRPFLSASFAASPALGTAIAYAQPAAAPLPGGIVIPQNTCVKPEYPGKLASAQRFTAFNKDVNAFGLCVKKYVDDTKLIVNAAASAGNGAVEDYDRFAADMKAQNEAAKN